MRLERADRPRPDEVEEIEGRSDSLTKVQAGGLSHARYQRSAEEVWKHNQSEVAEVVDRLAEQQRLEFIMLAGDVRARQLLKDSLNENASGLVVEHDAHIRAEGSDREGMSEAIAEVLEQRIADEIDTATDQASETEGAGGARGVAAVVEALQQARVDTLILDARFIENEGTLRALEEEPWVAAQSQTGFDTEELGDISAAEALARAAVLTGARVLIREETFTSDDEPREHAEVPEPIAVLRWSDDDAAG